MEELYKDAKEDKCMAQILREVAVTRVVTSTGKEVTHGKWLLKLLSGVVACAACVLWTFHSHGCGGGWAAGEGGWSALMVFSFGKR